MKFLPEIIGAVIVVSVLGWLWFPTKPKEEKLSEHWRGWKGGDDGS